MPLILPDGYKKWSDHNDAFTPGRFDGRKLRRETGYQPSEQAVAKDAGQEIKRPKGWVLPQNFCPDCERSDITPKRGLDGSLRLNPGITELSESRPDLKLQAGEVIINWICHDCMDKENWGSINIHGPADQRKFFADIHERREQNTEAWIKAAISRGEEPREGQRSY